MSINIDLFISFLCSPIDLSILYRSPSAWSTYFTLDSFNFETHWRAIISSSLCHGCTCSTISSLDFSHLFPFNVPNAHRVVFWIKFRSTCISSTVFTSCCCFCSSAKFFFCWEYTYNVAFYSNDNENRPFGKCGRIEDVTNERIPMSRIAVIYITAVYFTTSDGCQ